jgi:hypothetical protein
MRLRQWLKYTTIVLVGIILLVVILPFTMNWLILRERWFDIVGGATDWLHFWPVYLSAIGTIAMTIATFYTLKANQKQIAYAIESEGAQLVFSLYSDYEYVLLKVTNVGRSMARNIQLNIPNNLDIIERNAGIPLGEGLINHFNNLNSIALLLPNQSDYVPLSMYRALGSSIKDNNGVKAVEMFGDLYSLDSINDIREYFKNQKFPVTCYYTNYLNQRHSISQEVDNTYNVLLSDEKNTVDRSLRELNKNLVSIKNGLHLSDTSKLKDIDTAIDKVKSELHSISDSLKKIEGKIKK